MVLAVRTAAPALAPLARMNPWLAGLLVATVPAAALPSAAPAREWERQPREGFGASEVVVGEQLVSRV
jgi:hypothetical protein